MKGPRLMTPGELRESARNCYVPRGRSRTTWCELPPGHRVGPGGSIDLGPMHSGRGRSGRWYSWAPSTAPLTPGEAFDRIERASLHGQMYGHAASLVAVLSAIEADPALAAALFDSDVYVEWESTRPGETLTRSTVPITYPWREVAG